MVGETRSLTRESSLESEATAEEVSRTIPSLTPPRDSDTTQQRGLPYSGEYINLRPLTT